VTGCAVLYYDPTRMRREPSGRPNGLAGDAWRPCTAPGRIWTDPDLILRWVCARHRRQLIVLHAAGLANQIRWQQPGLATDDPRREEQAQ
jgi:hypothetical protein